MYIIFVMKFQERLAFITFAFVLLIGIHQLHFHNGNQSKTFLYLEMKKSSKQGEADDDGASIGKSRRQQMIQLHQKVNKKLTASQILRFYQRERISQSVYGERILDLAKDYKTLMALFPDINGVRDRVTDQLHTKIKVEKVKNIFIQDAALYKDADLEKCNVKKCRLTSDISHLKHMDAILWDSSSPLNLKYKRTKDQVIINFQMESPAKYGLFSEEVGLNWTASYRRDSVLNAPYERFTPFLNTTTLPTKPKRNFAKGKTKKIAWFVSNCGGTNRRMSYAKELQKYIQVDIYGNCGNLRCRRGDNRCFEKLKQDYKFYLAFENSNCKDLISEKVFFNTLSHDVLPIVMGAHPDDYKEIAPPNSYIHIDEFESPQHLAKYLNFLDQNDHLYNQYFLWRGTGSFINTKFMCRLCTMVHLAPLFPMWYTNSNRWWYNQETCVEPTLQNRVRYSTWRGKKQPKDSTNTINYGYDRKV